MAKTLAERTGLRFTKRRPRKLPDPPYVMAHCRAGWVVLSGNVLTEYTYASDTGRRIRVHGVCFHLTQDKKHYSDGLIVQIAKHN